LRAFAVSLKALSRACPEGWPFAPVLAEPVGAGLEPGDAPGVFMRKVDAAFSEEPASSRLDLALWVRAEHVE